MAKFGDAADLGKIIQEFQVDKGLPFSNLLKPERLDAVFEKFEIKFRDRVFNPKVTLWTFLSQVLSADHSCRDAVTRVLAWRAQSGMPACSARTSGYCGARMRLPLEAVEHLVRETGRHIEANVQNEWRWNARSVKLVDGTTVTMPDTDENQAAYPQRGIQKPGVGFPIARVVTVISLATGAVLDAAIAPMRGKQTGETTLFRRMEGVLDPGDMVLADRIFAGYRDIAACRDRNVDVVARQHASRNTDFRQGRSLGPEDHIVWWKRPRFDSSRFDREEWESLPTEMEVRELRFEVTQPGFRTREIVVITTLLDVEKYPREKIAELYRARWNCELDLRSIKSSMQMSHLRCQTPEMIQKEIWVHFLAYNLTREVMAEAARAHDQQPRRLGFKGAVQSINSFAPYLGASRTEHATIWTQLLRAIATHVVGDRPDRYEPRKLKRRVGHYTYMTRPRSEERQRLCA